MTATHNPPRRTRKTSRCTARRRQLPRLGWGWAIPALAVIGIARTWPIWTALAVALVATAAIVRAIRPRRFNHLWHGLDWIAEHRRTLPRPGHGTRTLSTFQRLTPAGFEAAIAELALEDRDHVATATTVGGSNDRGADVLIHLNDGRRILVQCKRYRNGNNVGSEDVQKTNGTYRDIHHCHQAVIVTTASYTRAAHDTNARLPYSIRLVDGPQIVAWANGGTPPWA